MDRENAANKRPGPRFNDTALFVLSASLVASQVLSDWCFTRPFLQEVGGVWYTEEDSRQATVAFFWPISCCLLLSLVMGIVGFFRCVLGAWRGRAYEMLLSSVSLAFCVATFFFCVLTAARAS